MSPSVSVRLLLTQSDSRLLAYAHAGHERAFEALVQRYRRPLLGYCRRLLLSEERAEDALQQALLQAWLALRSGTEVNDVKPWLFRIVHNAALNALRVSGYDYCKLSESLSGANAPQEDLDRRIAVREALAGLAALPQMQREALLRTAVEGNSHQQVARELGLSENALRGLVYRARATLRAAAGAIVPPPLVSWALGSGGRGAPVIERLAELGAGGGSAGVAGLLMKGGAVAVTASVMAGGIAAVHHQPKRSDRHAASHATGHLTHSDTTRLAVAQGRSVNTSPIPSGAHAPVRRKRSSNHLPAERHRHAGRQPDMPFTTGIPTQPDPLSAKARHGDNRGDGSGDHKNDQSPGPNSTAGEAGARDGGNAPSEAGQGTDDGDRSSHDKPNDSQTSSSEPSGGDGQGVPVSGEGNGSSDEGGQEGSHDSGGSSGARSSTTTSSSSKDGQGATVEDHNGS
jgi:RNA polymerase sigma factor (sigma-70 family)